VSEPPRYSLALKQLAPDAARAGVECADVRREAVGARELRALLAALARLAPTVEYPLRPEIRIADGERQFLVQVKEGRMQLSGWTVPAGFADGSADGIWSAITGEAADGAAGEGLPRPGAARTGSRRRPGLIAVLVVTMLAANGATAWWLTRPAPSLMPAYRLLEDEPGRRLLERLAGDYETGGAEGDRRMKIRRDGTVVWSKYGPAKAIAEETTFSAAAAETAGGGALLTGDHALIEVRDPLTVVYFGDVYRRIQPP
jgi:hypothetical protein